MPVFITGQQNCYLNDFVFLLPSPYYQCWETMRKNCIKLCFVFATLYRERGILNLIFKIPIMFCHWLSEGYKKKRKTRFYSCCYKKLKCTLMSSIMLWHTLSWTLRQQTVPKWRKKCTNNIFLALVPKGFLQGHNGECCCFLSCYV